MASKPALSCADVHREVGRYADGLALPRPSYERIRVFVRTSRTEVGRRNEVVDALVGTALYTRPTNDLVGVLQGDPPRPPR
jgi:hypothetical protein